MIGTNEQLHRLRILRDRLRRQGDTEAVQFLDEMEEYFYS